jgi:hypothetical protein
MAVHPLDDILCAFSFDLLFHVGPLTLMPEIKNSLPRIGSRNQPFSPLFLFPSN